MMVEVKIRDLIANLNMHWWDKVSSWRKIYPRVPEEGRLFKSNVVIFDDVISSSTLF